MRKNRPHLHSSPLTVIARKIRRALRGEVSVGAAFLEAGRRSRVALRERVLARESAVRSGGAARLSHEFARKEAPELLDHFRTRQSPKFLPGIDAPAAAQARVMRERFPAETARLIEQARAIVDNHRWSLLGYGARDFGAEIDWLRDPVSGVRWPLVYHTRVNLFRGDGSDARVLWELNRLSHLVTLGRAYAVTDDPQFAEEFFGEVEDWRSQNPRGRGPNWACAMEVALRAINLLTAFRLFCRAPELNEARLSMLLEMFEDHGAHVRRNLEFSYLATSNHYLSDVVGLLWLGLLLPELRAAREWREFGLREMLREMDKQILADGADGESSTGYHRFVLELFLYSFILCRANRIEIDERQWQTLYSMLDYVRAYLRPDGRAPLIGDTDGGRVLPFAERAADEHAYLLAVGAALFDEPRFRLAGGAPEELLWSLGEQGLLAYEELAADAHAPSSSAFPEAGTYVLREGEQYLLFNTSGAGLGGRGSHAHNDALSLDVSACGQSFISDPGTYVYTSDLHERHLFRSTAYHSTVEVDGAEQNTTDPEMPFVIGDEARPRVLSWETGPERDLVIAEHYGYGRLAEPITHRRAVMFDKRNRHWLVEDALLGSGEHVFRFLFHVAHGREVRVRPDAIVEVYDKMAGAHLLIVSLDVRERPSLEPRWASCDYGAKRPSNAVCWTVRARAPLVSAWLLLPVCAGEDESERLKIEVRG